MVCKVRKTFLYVAVSFFFCAALYHRHFSRSADVIPFTTASSTANHVIHENPYAAAAVTPSYAATPVPIKTTFTSAPPSPPSPPTISTTAVLLPDWEVLVIVSPETVPLTDRDSYVCVFATNVVSPARFSGILQFPYRATFSCTMPVKARRKLPLRQPVLLKSPEEYQKAQSPPHPPLMRWSYLVYDSLTTEDDVVLFVKGVNTRQGRNRPAIEFRCIFGDNYEVNGVKTAVTSSMQEVFRCKRPDLTTVTHVGGESNLPPLKVSLELVNENRAVPSVAYYTPPRKLETQKGKSLLCAATVVYDVSKFLKEWVLYHSEIGVQKFIFYDNGSDDDLRGVAAALAAEGFDVTRYPWRWPKTQESGFSHSSIYGKDVCKWMMFLDVDEFLYSPTWNTLGAPSESLLNRSLISQNSSEFGQIMVSCREFGPSGQKVHPPAGVTIGYNCRRKNENRHKSVVLLDALDHSLANVIHHFQLREGYKTKKMSAEAMVVNHYKYQAWPEFKAKFRRRVSAYVVDWSKNSNPNSKDRAPGLGNAPMEPEEWVNSFCDLRDEGLKNLVLRWFGNGSGRETVMPWQR